MLRSSCARAVPAAPRLAKESTAIARSARSFGHVPTRPDARRHVAARRRARNRFQPAVPQPGRGARAHVCVPTCPDARRHAIPNLLSHGDAPGALRADDRISANPRGLTPSCFLPRFSGVPRRSVCWGLVAGGRKQGAGGLGKKDCLTQVHILERFSP